MRKQTLIDDDEELPRRPEETSNTLMGAYAVKIENIKEMRDRRGIDDTDLRQDIRGLARGDLVRLTVVTGPEPFGGVTLMVRITHIEGHRFQGQLAKRPSASGLSKLHLGASVAFTAAHIHSLVSK